MESIKNLEDFNTKLRAQRHDYLNHFQVIYGLMDLEEYEEAKKYIEPVFKDILKVSKALKTAQPAVNALLQAKIEAAEKKNIDLYLEIRSELKNISIEPWNLCKVIANLIDNSITALSECDKEKKIYLDIGEDLNHYTFQVTNNGPKIPQSELAEIFKQGYTTKKEEEHGIGLFIVSSIIDEAGGSIRVNSNEEKTSFYFELPKISNR
jgi:sensor histidine kinase regulating citrate/malate metabolism